MATQAHAAQVISRARANRFYARALTSCPEYVAAVELRDRLLEAKQTLPGVRAVPAPRNADDDLDAWLSAVVAADAAERERDVKTAALTAERISCDKRIESLAVTQTDRILGCLDADLADVMAKVESVVERLDGARTPQQVIDRGVGDAWRELRPLRADYDAIRAAQDWAMAGEMLHTSSRSDYWAGDPMASDCALQNLDEVWPGWKSKPVGEYSLSVAVDDPRPWPPDPVEQLVWLCTSAAQAWVPTIAELEQLGRERLQRINNPEPASETIGAH